MKFKQYEDKDKNLLIVNEDISILPLLAAVHSNFNQVT
jgi:hypothetical protein